MFLVLIGCGTRTEENGISADMGTEAAADGTEQAGETIESPSGIPVMYSNLNDGESRLLAEKLFAESGVSEERAQIFLQHLDQFNSSVEAGELTSSFEERAPRETRYDPYAMQDEWNEAHPDFQGYNCRITAYGLFGDFIQAEKKTDLNTDALAFDFISLEEDPSAVPGETEKNTFTALYGAVPTEATKDIAIHYAKMKQAWKERGITFKESEKIRLISVIFHNQITEGEDELFIGHVGVLFPGDNGDMYLVEKVAFQEPYRINCFKDREALNRYFMDKYDVEFGQPTARPFVMENDRLLMENP